MRPSREPRRLTLVVYKAERRLVVWEHPGPGTAVRRAVFPILAASGGPGPKRFEGDLQVPEGVYRLTGLNPRSRFHLSIRVGYPNADDVAHRLSPTRPLGGDIYIHGGAASIGCVAIGDAAIERLYGWVEAAGLRRCVAVLVPCDLVRRPAPSAAEPWIAALYDRLRRRLLALESAAGTATRSAGGRRPGPPSPHR